MEVKEILRNSSFVKRALGFEEAGIFGDMEDICPTEKIGDHIRKSEIDFEKISKVSGLLAKSLAPSFKAQ